MSACKSTITIDCNKKLGEAAHIREWMGSGFIRYLDPSVWIRDQDHPLIQAWHRVGFRYVPFEVLVSYGGDSNEWHLNLGRDSSGKLIIDFTPWDKLLYIAYQILNAEPSIAFSFTPRELSKHPTDIEYAECMPRDLHELQDFCKRVVKHTIQWGDENIKPGATKGLFYSPIEEPDWQGYRNEPEEPQAVAKLNSILYYAACFRGIKAADPTAKVGGPRHGQWQHPVPVNFNAAFSFRDWLEEFKHYLDAHPDIGADFFSWQDYHYFFEGPNISDGADAVRGYLRELNFANAGDVPLILAGGAGGGSWGDDYTDNKKPKYKMAAYAARNIIREFNSGTAGRKFGRAEYYSFAEKNEYRSGEAVHSALIWIDDSTDPVTLEYTAIYAAFEMMKLMIQEDDLETQIVQVQSSESLEVMATFAKYPAIIICNYSGQVHDIDLKINLPAEYGTDLTKLKACIQRIDAHHSNDGKGLEPEEKCWWPQPIAIESDPTTKETHMQLALHGEEAIAAWGTVLIRFYP